MMTHSDWISYLYVSIVKISLEKTFIVHLKVDKKINLLHAS